MVHAAYRRGGVYPSLVQTNWFNITRTDGLRYLGTRDQLGGGQGTLGGGSDHPVLEHGVLGDLGHVLRLQHQHGGGVGHGFGQIHQDVLETHHSRGSDVKANISSNTNSAIFI